ncbi:MAG: DUF2207 domain-containing protein [Actinomycetia bacterium]|nr:DUF2207 domain-containing protein [Actinomycetes bacterium]MCP4957748.1 DUF2207 domain-containing protein [Actinomycetes bacterium]
MAYRSRRKLDAILLVLSAVLVGIISLIGAAVGDGERIVGYWAMAMVEPGGGQITEVIDYDFGPSSRHGIFRDVPGLAPTAAVTVESTTAPDRFVLEPSYAETRIRIGDPHSTIRDRHRYNITYPLLFDSFDGRISWNAIGAAWPVSIADVEVHLLSDRELTSPLCSKGEAGAWDGCTVESIGPGHLMVNVDRLGAFEGVTVSAVPGATLAVLPAAPVAPTGEADDPGSGLLRPALTAVVFALFAAAVASRWVRSRGREWVWIGGSADAAFGPQLGEQYRARLVDHEELDLLASTEFVPPGGLTAWQGGVLYTEKATMDHCVAWLLERAIDGEIEITGTGRDVTLHRLAVDSNESEALDRLFGGRKRVALGKYDQQFASGWSALGIRLGKWYDDSALWDPSGDRRKTVVRVSGVIALVLGAIVVAVSAAMANRWGLVWLAGVGIGATAVGAGWSLLIRSWELRIRTPEGSGLWIRTESFRRFIEGSDAQHVEEAAQRGLLREYTAWAVALGEVGAWSDAVEQAERSGRISGLDSTGLYFAATALNLGSAAAAAAKAPSSSGSGGGSVGGGSGGGGGGSW